MFIAERVITIDRVPERLQMAREHGEAETLDFSDEYVFDKLKEMTGGCRSDSCLDAVGIEAHSTGSIDALYDAAKAAMFLATDRPRALRQAIHACRKGGTVSVPSVYGGFLNKIPFGAVVKKGECSPFVDFEKAPCHVQWRKTKAKQSVPLPEDE